MSLSRPLASPAALAWVVMLTTLGCADPRMTLRYGTLIPGDRKLDYAPGASLFTLDNGLRVALIADPGANLVSVDVRYQVGAAEDPPGKAGLAHLVEHMLFEQRVPLDPPDGPTLGDRLQAAALSYNAFTTWDATHYSDVGLADSLPELLALEATRLTLGCTGIDQATFERERSVVLQEAAQRTQDGLVAVVLRELFGAGHPYGRASRDRDVARLTLADVCEFVDAYYAPARAILVVGGPIEPVALRAEISRRFGAVQRRATGALARVPPLAPSRRIGALRAATDEPTAVVAFAAAPWGSREAFDDRLLASVVHGRLAELAEHAPWITGVGAGTIGGKRESAQYFQLTVSDPARLDDAVAAVFRVTDELRDADLSDELLRIGAIWMTDLLTGFESVAGRGAWCADYLQFANDPQLHLRELRALQAIDAERVRHRARRWARPTSRITRIVPEPARRHVTRHRLPVGAASTELPAWHAAVDPAEADRALALPSPPRPRAVTELRLDNGLRVVLVPDFTQPVIDVRLVFPVGESGTTTPAGIATAAAELLSHDFDRTYTTREVWLLSWVLSLGARMSATVSDAHTTFAARGSSLHGGWHLWRLYWLLQNGTYRESAVAGVRNGLSRDARASHAWSTARTWRRALRAAVFGRDHPYARDVAPTHLQAALVPEALERFREAHYHATGATLIVVGRFDPAALRPAITELFGAWPAGPTTGAPAVPAMRPETGPTWLAHANPAATQLRVTVAFAASSPRAPSLAARAVLTEIVRRRVEVVRSELGASYGIDAGYARSAAGDTLVVDGQVDASRGGEALRRVKAALDGLRDGDDQLVADFVRARRAAVARALAAASESSFTAARLEAAAAEGRPLDSDDGEASAIAATSPADIRALIAADLQAARTVGILSGRRGEVRAAFAAAGVTDARVAELGR
jgi:zinc protease